MRHESLAAFNRKRQSDEGGGDIVAADTTLRDIDYLMSRVGKNLNVVVFGLLSQLEEGKFFLEDPTGVLLLDLTRTVSFFFRLYRAR